jgi:hypothetical protein
MQVYTEEDVRRAGSVTASWRPFVDAERGHRRYGPRQAPDPFICRYNECPDQGTLRRGRRSDLEQSQLLGEADERIELAGAPLGEPQDDVQRRLHERRDGLHSVQQRQPSPAQTVSAATRLDRTNWRRRPDARVYAQEQFGIRDRLFITARCAPARTRAFGTNLARVLRS